MKKIKANAIIIIKKAEEDSLKINLKTGVAKNSASNNKIQ
jgi:hypothetical protein